MPVTMTWGCITNAWQNTWGSPLKPSPDWPPGGGEVRVEMQGEKCEMSTHHGLRMSQEHDPEPKKDLIDVVVMIACYKSKKKKKKV